MNVAVIKTKAETTLSEGFGQVAERLPGGADVQQAREDALGRFASLGLPHRRIEEWKYTDLRNAMKEALPVAVADEAKVTIADIIVALGPLAQLDAPRIVLVNGRYRRELSNLADASSIAVEPLSQALVGSDGAAGLLSDSGGDNAILALNAAYVTDGAVIDVPAGATLEKPLLVVHSRAGVEPRFAVGRNVIHIGEAATATVVEVFVTVPGSATEGQVNTASEVLVGAGATARHVKIAVDAGKVTHLANWTVEMEKDSVYRGFQFTSGVGLARNEIRATFKGEGAKLDISGIFLARGTEHIDTTLFVDHAVPHGESRELFKGVLDDTARGIFQGKVIVRRDAQKTDGKQMAQALMLSEDAEFDSKPELEIYADDVVCGHGSTSAQLDDDLMFYLRARGIPKEEARALLIQSFIGEAIDKIEHDGLREALAEQARIWLLGVGV
ncbi:MAG: Fe-S cluster assembly protein SufD [Hyphomicrobiaceae bacterium]|nr:Fe-S cluster assembly protein SufD [Hyphomicrobiaceae bacterium]